MIIGVTSVKKESETIRFPYRLRGHREGNSFSKGHRSSRLGSDSRHQDFADIILQRPIFEATQGRKLPRIITQQ